jgi:hypothetical protein
MQDRVGEQQPRRLQLVTVVADPQCGPGGQVAAGAGSAKAEPSSVDAQPVGLGRHPAPGGDHVVVRHWELHPTTARR